MKIFSHICHVLFIAFTVVVDIGAQNGRVEVTVEDCRKMAGEHSVQMRNADLDVEAAQMQREEARAGYFPEVSAYAFGFYALDPMLEIGVKDLFGKTEATEKLQEALDKIVPELGFNSVYRTLQNGAVAMVSFMQPVFAGGRIVAGNRLSLLGVEAAKLQRNIAARTSDEQIDRLYWQVVSLQEKQNTLMQMKSMLDTICRDVRSAYDAGLASNTDLMQVELKQSELSVGQIQLDNGIRIAKMNILNGIGMNYSYIQRDDEAYPFIDSIRFVGNFNEMLSPEDVYISETEVAARQEEMRLLELAVDAKRLERRMVLGEALPQVAVGANYGYSYIFDKGNWNGAVFAVVQIPISDWGKNARKIQRFDIQIEKAENERVYLSEQILLQIRQLWFDLTSSWQQMLVMKQSLVLAESNLDQIFAYYRAGMVSLSELLQAQTQLSQARESYTSQALEYATALNAYRYRTGK